MLSKGPLFPSVSQLLIYCRFKEWGDRYGPIFSLKIGAGTIVVLNDRRAIHDLIDKKSAIYSERAVDHQFDLTLGGENFSFMSVTPIWRAQRKIAAHALAPAAIDKRISKIQESEYEMRR
jgi:cytochrome P450